MTELLLHKVLAKLDLLCLEYHPEGYFACIGEPPVWSIELFSCIRNRFPRILPIDISSFLDNFMVDAVEFWQSGSSTIFRSGYWTESSSAFAQETRDPSSAQDVNLEALVLSVDGHSLLLLEVSPVKFDQTFQWLQLARVERLDSLIERKANASQMTSLSLFDSLTGCSNKQALTIQLSQWLEQLKQGFISQFLLIKLNVDRFRHVNFTLGTSRGDQCLQQFSQRLKAYVGEQDLVARLGADEFALLVRIPSGLSQQAWLDQLMFRLRSPYRLGSHHVTVTTGIGLCTIKDADWSVETCFLNVSFALSQAKALGRGQWVEFDRGISESILDDMAQEQKLVSALFNQELQVSFRPLFSAKNRQVIGCETILNWPTLISLDSDFSNLDAVVQSAKLEPQLATYQGQVYLSLLKARPQRFPLLLFIHGPLESILDPHFQQVIKSFNPLLQPGDQVVLKISAIHNLKASELNQLNHICYSLNLKLCVPQQSLSALSCLGALTHAVQYISSPISALFPPLSRQHILSLSQWQNAAPQILLVGEQITNSHEYQQAIAMPDLDLFEGDHLGAPQPLDAFLKLLH